ncbi:MAG: hypothetical protein ABSE92_03700 [Terriglobales bacterium]|jgi:hypothetical protein
MIPQHQLDEFVVRLSHAAGNNLQSVILYGSAADGEFHREFSNVNLLCVLRDASLPQLVGLADAADSWTRLHHPAPLIMTQDEITRSADVFSIEFMDMKRRYKVLYGEDVLLKLAVPMHLHRAQLEYELREKMILLRQSVLAAARDEKRLWEIMLSSLSAFTTLFRHVLIALGESGGLHSREAIRALHSRIAFDTSPFEHLFDIREHRADRKQLDPRQILDNYLHAIQQVTTAVDTMLDSPQKA